MLRRLDRPRRGPALSAGERAPAGHGTPPAVRYFPELEALRGVAVVLVVWTHIDAAVAPAVDPAGVLALHAAARADRLGIDLFFLLSGFLLSRPWLEALASDRPLGVGRFLRRRCLRALPLYWAVVVAGTVATAATFADLGRGLPYLFFLNSLPAWAQPLPGWSGLWWSVATGAQFCAVLPVLGVLLRPRWGRPIVVALLSFYAVAYLSFRWGLWLPDSVGATLSLQESLFGRAPFFLGGIAAAELHRRFTPAVGELVGRSSLWPRGLGDLSCAGAIALVALSVRAPATTPAIAPMASVGQGADLRTASLLAVTILLLLWMPLRARAILVNRFWIRLGVLSYAIFLLHAPLWHGYALWVAPEPADVALIALWAMVLVALAGVIFRFVERPLRRRREPDSSTVAPANRSAGDVAPSLARRVTLRRHAARLAIFLRLPMPERIVLSGYTIAAVFLAVALGSFSPTGLIVGWARLAGAVARWRMRGVASAVPSNRSGLDLARRERLIVMAAGVARPGRPCLPAALLLWGRDLIAGLPSRLVIGVRTAPQFLAHAWIERADGTIAGAGGAGERMVALAVWGPDGTLLRGERVARSAVARAA